MLTIKCDHCKTEGYTVSPVGVFMRKMTIDLKEPTGKDYFYRPMIGHLCTDCQEELRKILDVVTNPYAEKR